MTAEPSDRLFTIPNLFTYARFAAIPIVISAGVFGDNFELATAAAAFAYISDLLDGYLARKLNQVSRIGILLDPLADRLAFAAVIAVLLVSNVVTGWLIWPIVVRDALFLLVGVPILKVRNLPIPAVTLLGKRSSFLVASGMACVMVSGSVGSIEDPTAALWWLGVAFLGVGVPLYMVSGLQYLRTSLTTSAKPSDS